LLGVSVSAEFYLIGSNPSNFLALLSSNIPKEIFGILETSSSASAEGLLS
jgi:hypothetical protein